MAHPPAALSSISLAVALFAASPHPARAASECGADGPGKDSLNCSAASYANGITYTNSDGLTLNLSNPSTVVSGTGVSLRTRLGPVAPELTVNVTNVTSITSTGIGVLVNSQAVGGLAAITIDGGTITSTGASSSAVSGVGGGSGANVVVTLNGGQIVNTSGGSGIVTQTAGLNGTGNATIVINGGTVQASGTGVGSAISGGNHTGTARVAMNGGSVLSIGSNALVASTTGRGQAQVQMSGGSATALGANGDGVFASSRTGTYNVDMTGGTVVGGSLNGAAIHTSAAAGGILNIGAGAIVNGGASGVAIRDGDANRDGIDEIGGNATITTAGTLTGAVLLGGGTDTLNIAGGSIAGNLTGDGADALNLNLGTDSFTHGAAFAISGMNSITMNSGTAQLDSTVAGNTLNVNGGALMLTAANSYTGGTFLNGGMLSVSRDANLGAAAGALNFNGGTLRNTAAFTSARTVTLGAGGGTFQTDADFTLSGAITGTGGLTKTGAATLLLNGTNIYQGVTTVVAGTLKAGAANTLSPASSVVVQSGATLDLAGFDQTVQGLRNAGTVLFNTGVPGTTLRVQGNYVGNAGVLRLSTSLGADGSSSDRLVIDGGTASGRTTVQVTNIGGLGALTTGNGIEIVSAVNGATTTAQSTKDAFALAGGHIDAGAYAYTLRAGDASGAGENWYLRSESTIPAPNAGGGTGSPAVTVPDYRAEVPLLAALPQQLRQADLAMLGNLHQRAGDVPVDAGGPGVHTSWGRFISSGIDTQLQGTVSPQSKGRLDGFQVGTDLFAADGWRAGVYLGQLEGNVGVRGFARGVQGTNVGDNYLRSRYVGAYANWTHSSGFYADAVLQAGDHRYTIRPQGNASVAGEGDSLLASIEVGQSFALGQGWTLEPQLQLIHQRVDVDDMAISAAQVRQDSDSGWIARTGLRIKGEMSSAAGALQPYGRLNLYRASNGTDAARFTGPAGSADIATRTGGSWVETAAGLTLALNSTWSVYGEVGQMFDIGGDARVSSGVQGSMGLKAGW